jgi:hypothetical protein
MTTLTLNSRLLSVLSALTQRKALAITESGLDLNDDDWMTVVRDYFYALPPDLITELGLKRNLRCIRAIQFLQIPDEWLDTEQDKLKQFTFTF